MKVLPAALFLAAASLALAGGIPQPCGDCVDIVTENSFRNEDCTNCYIDCNSSWTHAVPGCTYDKYDVSTIVINTICTLTQASYDINGRCVCGDEIGQVNTSFQNHKGVGKCTSPGQ